MTAAGTGIRLVVDANILICINGFDRWPALFAFLDRCESTLVTIESVYRREIDDSMRPTLDRMLADDRLAIVRDPDKVVQKPRSVRQLQKKITRKARRCPPTSQVDRQLLLVALRDDHPLLTDERPLRDLARLCNVPVHYDLLDVIEALYAGRAINRNDRERLLSSNPGGRQDSPDELEQRLADRGGDERFDCG